jgi:hypothetical protein
MPFPTLSSDSKFIAVDTSSNIYFIDRTLNKCSQRGTDAQYLLDVPNPKGIAVNTLFKYIVDGNDIKIYGIDSSAVLTTITVSNFKGIAANDSKLYVADGGTIRQYATDGTNGSTLISGFNDIKGICLVTTRMHVIDGNMVKSIGLTGTPSILTRISNLIIPSAIAANANYVYVVDGTKLLQYNPSFTLQTTYEYVSPKSIALNSAGDVFLIDNAEIKKLSSTYNSLTSSANYSNFNNIGTVDSTGRQYIINGGVVQTITSGVVSTTTILVGVPKGIAVNGSYIYIVDGNFVNIYDKTSYESSGQIYVENIFLVFSTLSSCLMLVSASDVFDSPSFKYLA